MGPLAALAHRGDARARARRLHAGAGQENPIEIFKRQCWVSIEPDEAPAKYAIDYVGSDQLVFSTDYPHGDSRYPNAVNAFLELDLTDEERRKILWDNCARFYKVEAPVPA